MSKRDPDNAFAHLRQVLKNGPCIASIHKGFDTRNGGHLIVATGVGCNTVYYNEPPQKHAWMFLDKFLSKNSSLAGLED